MECEIKNGIPYIKRENTDYADEMIMSYIHFLPQDAKHRVIDILKKLNKYYTSFLSCLDMLNEFVEYINNHEEEITKQFKGEH